MSTTSATTQLYSPTGNCTVSCLLDTNINSGESLRLLLRPLQRLNQRLTHMIAVANVLKGTAFGTCLIGATVTGDEPLIAQTSTASRLSKLKAAFELSDFDVEVLLLAIAPEIDRRYERLYAQLQQHAFGQEYRKPTIALSLNVLCPDSTRKENACHRFSPDAPLIQFGLIRVGESAIESERTLTLDPTISRYLRGLSVQPQRLPYAEMSWPDKIAHVPHSPMLPDLLHRLRSEAMPTPLMLKFVGEGEKEISARAIAATVKRPLLTVSLENMFDDNIPEKSDSAILHKAQRVLLQARLWNAVVYIKAAHRKLQTSISKFFFDRIATHSGITIFTGHIPAIPHSNHNKGLIPVPFVSPTAVSSTLSLSHAWHSGMRSARTTLRSTTLFEQILVNH